MEPFFANAARRMNVGKLPKQVIGGDKF